MSSTPRIAHISADFPDPIAPRKTTAIRSLVDLAADDFDNLVISLNRASPGFPEGIRLLFPSADGGKMVISEQSFPYGSALAYRAPGKGIFHRTMLRRLGRWLAARLSPWQPDLIIGHKLTIEGIAAREAAQILGIPFAISIQGNTDEKILNLRPDLRAEYASIFHEAAVIFPFTPWAERAFAQALGHRAGPSVLLPCPTDLDEPADSALHGDTIVSVFHLADWRNKNLRGMLAAHAAMQSAGIDVGLEIIGGGNARDTASCRDLVGDHPLVRLAGPLDHQALRSRMAQAKGLVLPSKRESFGLVFVEALFAGLPIAFPRGAAVDGYFDNLPFAIPVDSGDHTSIRRAMEQLVQEEGALKAALAQWHACGGSMPFTRPAIGKSLVSGLRLALGGQNRSHAGSKAPGQAGDRARG